MNLKVDQELNQALSTDKPNVKADPNSSDVRERRRSRRDQIKAWKSAQLIGENNKGLLEARTADGSLSDSVKKVVDAENADRRLVFQAIAGKQNIPVESVAQRMGARMAERSAEGPGSRTAPENGRSKPGNETAMSRFECDLYPEQRFRCLCCSFGCCDRFEIPVSPEEARAIDALHIPGAPSFDDCFRPGIMNAGLVIAKDAQHHCVFADGRLCAIHKHHGFAAKPLACRIFPLNIQSWADGRVSAELRFICPSAGSADGKRTGDMLDEIAIYSRQLAGLGRKNDCIYSHANPAPLAAVRSVHDAFRALLHEEEKPLAFRLYAAARILDFHARPDMGRGRSGPPVKASAADPAEFVGKAAKDSKMS